MPNSGVWDEETGGWRALTPDDLKPVINAENIDLDLDPQVLADAGNLAPDGSPAEGSANALLAAIKTAIEELEISGGGASAGDIATAINNALRASDLGVAVADLDTLATAALQTDIKGLLTEIRDGLGGPAALPAGTDRSGSVTTGGTAQQLAAANGSRKGLVGQNISDGDLWIDETGGTAAPDTAGSYRVLPGGTFDVSTNRAISIVGATTGQAWTATEY